jgi:hypothetical protein
MIMMFTGDHMAKVGFVSVKTHVHRNAPDSIAFNSLSNVNGLKKKPCTNK